MKSKRFTLPLLGIAGLVISTATACASSSNGGGGSSGSSAPFVVGAVLPISGDYSAVGVAEQPALKAIAAYYNKKGGVLGHKIELHIVNDGSSLQQAISATRSLASKYQMNLFIPDTISAQTLATLPLAPNALSVSVCASDDCGNPAKFPLAFDMNPPPDALFQATARYIADQGYKRVGMLADDTTSGHSFDTVTTQYLKKLGVTVTAHEFATPGTTDVSVQLSKLKSDGVSAVAAWVSGIGLDTATRSFQAIGWKVPIILPNGFNYPQSVDSLVPPSVAPQVMCVCDAVSVRGGSQLPAHIDALLNIMKGYGAVSSLQLTALTLDEFTVARYGYEKAGSLDAKKAAAALQRIGSDPSVAKSSDFFAYYGVNPGFTASSHFPAVSTLLSHFFGTATVAKAINGTYPGSVTAFQSVP
jgi:ABC-type branched-subunit amino acid transport system substrate-binding protein